MLSLSSHLLSIPQNYRPVLFLRTISLKTPSKSLISQRAANTRIFNIRNIQERFYTIENKTNDILITPEKILNKPKDTTLSISERASHRLSEIYINSKKILQISVESGGCHGYQYSLKLIPDIKDISPWEKLEKKELNSEAKVDPSNQHDEFDEFDELSPEKNVLYILPNNKGKILINKMSLKILNKTTLIYTTELIGSSFKIINGKLKSKCGCGSSFDLED